MPMDKSGKYHMNPHNAKMADSAPPKGGSADTSAPAPDAGMDMGADPDAGAQMITCPSCGSQFPEEMGLAQPEAMPQPQQPHEASSAPSGLSGY